MRHFKHSAPLAIGLAIVAATACQDGPTPTGPGLDEVFTSSGLEGAAMAAIDISGSWDWHETVHLAASEELGPMFGFIPEGPVTQLWCRSAGTMTLVQSGSSFSGSSTQSSECETNGGQVFVPLAFPPALDVVDGEIRGRHIAFLLGAGPIPCPYTATIRMQGGTPVALEGAGRCITPGHPQNSLPVPPPPLGPGSTVSWSASR